MPDTKPVFQGGKQPRRPGAKPSAVHAGFIRPLVFGMALPAVAAAAQSAVAADWAVAGGAPQGTRYSALADITPANAGQLKEEFSFQTGVKGSHMGEPLVVGNTLYVVTPYPNLLIAYDLGTGVSNSTL